MIATSKVFEIQPSSLSSVPTTENHRKRLNIQSADPTRILRPGFLSHSVGHRDPIGFGIGSFDLGYIKLSFVCIIVQSVLSQFSVRTIIELIANETYYESMCSLFVGSVSFAIKIICKNYTFSELYEISALCSILRCWGGGAS